MSSWVYLFSQFTPEALLFEGLLICALFCGYAAFWILKKRRFGVIDREVPAGVVKVYLNELIQDAHQMRTQLFGLLRTAGVEMEPGMSSSLGSSPSLNLTSLDSADPLLKEQIAQFELRMAEQTKALQKVMAEKDKIEQELAAAKSQGSIDGNAGPVDGEGDSPAAANALKELKEKIGLLEGRLAEYSVIEDDLANLKRLQQENAQLKAQLENGESPSEPASEPEMDLSAEAPELEEPSIESEEVLSSQAETPEANVSEAPSAEPAPAPVPLAQATETQAEASAPLENVTTDDPTEALKEAEMSVSESAETTPAEDTAFEGLVDQVEQSLQSPQVELTESSPMDSLEKSDADLVAEFEKMLKP